jgi:acyl-coenzyme A thioesterase PaaI-like protein
MIEFLIKTADNLPIVQSLTNDPAWTHNEAYEGFNDDIKPHRLTTGPLGGARGLGGFQRVFHNADTGECIVVVFIGGAVAGWPGVTHGGLTATIMDEALGRVAITQLPEHTGVTANLELNYMKPIVTNSFYVIRSVPQKEGSTDKKQFVSGRLETLDGKICVEAKGLFVVPKNFKTKPINTF